MGQKSNFAISELIMCKTCVMYWIGVWHSMALIIVMYVPMVPMFLINPYNRYGVIHQNLSIVSYR